MPKLSQVSFAAGEIDPSLGMRTDLARYAIALKTCRNFFVRATGGVSNRAGLQYVAALDPDSLSTLIPFIFSTEQAYIMVLQDGSINVYSNGAFVQNAITHAISNVFLVGVGATRPRLIETATPHGALVGDPVTITGVVATGGYDVNGSWTVLTTPTASRFTIASGKPVGSYTSGGIAAFPIPIVTDFVSNDLAAIRYTQSADVLTLAHKMYPASELVRTDATTFSFDEIADFENGPFLDDNDTATTVTSSAATGAGITLTASASIFTAAHIGALFRIDLNDLSAIPPWEPSKLLAAAGVNPLNLQRRANGKVYQCATNEVAGADGTYTGSVRPSHDEGTEDDGDGHAITSLATRAGVAWTYLHSLFGVARITAQAGTTATADVLTYMPVVSPATSVIWSFGAWSEDQGYPGVVTYFGDRLVFANTPGQPQTEWASKAAEYHNFGISNPLVDDDSIRQTLNARQVNAIVELVPLDQLVALTSSSSWASPRRGEIWTPQTIGFDPQSYNGAADLRSLIVGDSALMAERGAQRVREIKFQLDIDKFGGEELSVLSRHLFGPTRYIVDWDYAKDPHGIVWVVRSDGALIGLTYLPEQQVIGWHRHDTDGFFERVCVIPEEGRDVPYFVVRRTVNGATVRYLERMASREIDGPLDGFFVDCGLTYDGRNTTATTITVSGVSYDGGAAVTLVSPAAIFAATDVDDVIQFDDVRIRITAYTSDVAVTGELETPLPAALQATATADWTFARNTFTGLDHLEGATVAICADGASVAQQVVASGSVTLPAAAGVVHIGLPYVGDLETLNVTIFGGEQIRDRAKTIPQVSVVVQDTGGLTAGPDTSRLEQLSRRDNEYYTDPLAAASGVSTAYLLNTWNKDGRVTLRQDVPLPATVLAILPKVAVGGDG